MQLIFQIQNLYYRALRQEAQFYRKDW